MNEKIMRNKMKALEMAAKHICNLRDGRCPMVMENYQCLSACGPDTLPWRCWIDHFVAVSGANETKEVKVDDVREFSNRIMPGNDHLGISRHGADRDW